jgi:hypothetical protein
LAAAFVSEKRSTHLVVDQPVGAVVEEDRCVDAAAADRFFG